MYACCVPGLELGTDSLFVEILEVRKAFSLTYMISFHSVSLPTQPWEICYYSKSLHSTSTIYAIPRTCPFWVGIDTSNQHTTLGHSFPSSTPCQTLKGSSVRFCIRGQMIRERTLLHLSGSDSSLLCVVVTPPH